MEYGTRSGSTGDLPNDIRSLADGGPVAASEYMLTAGYATELWGVSVGGAAKLVGQRLGSATGSTAAVDVGAGRDAGPVSLALTVRNLGRDLDLRPEFNRELPAADGQTPGSALPFLSPVAIPLARRVVLGAATDRAPVGPLDIGVAAEIALDRGGEVVPAGGIEVAWWPILRRVFIGRFGIARTGPSGHEEAVAPGSADLTFGAGFAGDRIRLDYAYCARGNGSHSFGLAWR